MRVISAQECGSGRISRYACPAHCQWLPFAPKNYDQLLELESSVDAICISRLNQMAAENPARQRELHKVRSDVNLHAFHAWAAWNLFFARDTSGETFAKKLENSGNLALKNDELVLFRAKQRMRMALLEVHRVHEDGMEAVDLLGGDPTPIRFLDRRVASVAVRFAVVLTWIYPLPHYWRLSGSAVVIPEIAQFEPREIIEEIVRHLGGPVTDVEMQLWLAENLVRFDKALMAVARARRMEMFAGMDAKYGKAVYELRAPFAECRNKLDEVIDTEIDSLADSERDEGFAEARSWFAEKPASEATPGGARMALGRVLLGQSHWRLEAFGAEKLGRLRARFDGHMGGLVRFNGERLDDLAANMAAKEPKFDAAMIPPRLLEQPQRFEFSSSRMDALPPGVSLEDAEKEIRRNAALSFLENSVPALGGRTPREAAQDPLWRPKLIRILKQRVRATDEHNLKTGGTEDLNWLLREVGVHEIIFDPPPPRPPTGSVEDDIEMGDDYAERPEVDPSLPPPPRLTGKPLSFEEASKRVQTLIRESDTAAAIEDDLLSRGLTLLDDAYEVSVDDLADDEFALAQMLIIQASAILIPKGCRAPETEFAAMAYAYQGNMNELDRVLQNKRADTMVRFINDSPQPGLMNVLASELIQLSLDGPKNIRPSLEVQPVLLALVKSAVEVLDAALRS